MNSPRSFAIVPAAGRSQRMGRHKLLLPWQGSTVIERVLGAWRSSDVSHVLVVIRKEDAELLAKCRNQGVDTFCPPDDPADMKASVQYGLRYLAERHRAVDSDVWLLAPADLPRLSAWLINLVLAEHNQREPAVIVPTVAGRRGHPVLFPWRVSNDVFQLGAEEGVNQVLDNHPTRSIPVSNQDMFEDVDTPGDYERLLWADRKEKM